MRHRCFAMQWRLVERSDTNNERVELVTFDVGAAARQQKRSLAELHYVQHGGKSCAPIIVTDDGFDDNRHSRAILVNASAAAHAFAELCAFSRQFGRKCISDCLFFLRPMLPRSCPATSLIGARGSCFIGGVHHGMSRCIAGQGNVAGQGNATSIHFFLQLRQLPSVVRSELGSHGSQCCLQSKAKTR